MQRCTLIDVKTRLKEIRVRAAALGMALALPLLPGLLHAQSTPVAADPPPPGQGPVRGDPGPPPSTGGFFPLSEVHRGLTATAWTVFQGSKPEPMEVEILGVLRGARGPGQDMILARLHGTKPEYTGVVAGMSGSPVYVGNKLLGSLSYRIGEFSKEPIAGITPIEQMLEVRDLPIDTAQRAYASRIESPFSRETTNPGPGQYADGVNLQAPFQAMETPLVMSGFSPDAIRLWQKQMAGTGLEMVAAGGMGRSRTSSICSMGVIPAMGSLLNSPMR